jgi:NADPH2:quinone reductase
MRAWIGQGRGTEASYELGNFDMPQAAANELLVRTRAVGINRVDQFPTTLHFQHSDPSPAAIPGLEAAGEVIAVGAQVTKFKVGDRVTSMVQGGCSEFVRMKADLAIAVPQSVSWAQAAAIPVSYLTAFNALFTLGRLSTTQSVLIHAVTSGVGLAALQLAALRGLTTVIGSSSLASKLDRLKPFGLTLGLVDPYSGFSQQVLDATGGEGVDVVVDHITGTLLNETMRCTAVGGRIVNVGRFGGTEASIDMNLHALRRIAFLGATFRTRKLEEHAAAVRDFLFEFNDSLANGMLVPMIDSVFAFEDMRGAIQRSLHREQLGKIVLEVRP